MFFFSWCFCSCDYIWLVRWQYTIGRDRTRRELLACRAWKQLSALRTRWGESFSYRSDLHLAISASVFLALVSGSVL